MSSHYFPYKRGLIPMLAAAALLVSCSGQASHPDPSQMPEVEALPVETLQIKRTSIDAIEHLPGRARASSEAEIRPQVTGLIKERLFLEGEEVAKGQPLYRIDSGDYVTVRDSSKAALERAKAAANLKQETAKRYKSLVDINAVSRQEYDQALADARQAEEDIAIQQAALDTAQLNLSRTTIRSPIAGQIGRSKVTAGALVTQNQASALASVVQLDPINVDLSVPSKRLLEFRQKLEEGKIETFADPANASRARGAFVPVTIRLDDNYTQQGQLQFREVSVDENDGTVAVRVTVPNPEGVILPGMYVNAEFSVGKYENAISIPQQAVVRDARGNASVYIVGADNNVEQRAVEIEDQSGNFWIISSGLESGEQLIVSHLQILQPGTPVQPTPFVNDAPLRSADARNDQSKVEE